MRKFMLFFALVMGFVFTSCSANCDCANCQTEECCTKCSTEQVETVQDSTGTVTDTVVVKESL